MFNFSKGVRTVLAISALLMMTAAVSFAQTTGSVTMTATVSNFVELTSGGAVTLTGNSGGSHHQQSSLTWANWDQAIPIVL
jgi:hypothetical protein